MGIPRNPRQAMINMMYLVLTALLALNISSEVLNAFLKVRDGLDVTNAQLLDASKANIDQIQKRAETDSTAQKWLDKALAVQTSASVAFAALDSAYMKIVTQSGSSKKNLSMRGLPEPTNLRDRDTPHDVMINKGNGDRLGAALEKARNAFASVYDTKPEQDQALESMTLQVTPPEPEGGGVQKTWAEDNFSEVPAVAALAVISKLQNDVRTSEIQAIEYLKSQIGIENIEFNQLQGRTFPKKSYLNSGETYEADIFVSASSSSVKPKVYIGSLDFDKIERDSAGGYVKEVKGLEEPPLLPGYTPLPPADAQGIVKYTATTGAVGPKTYSGVIEVLNAKTGGLVYYPFEGEYLVAQAVAVVSPTKMNMFYIGVDNPVEVSVPGYANTDVSASITAGSITPAGGSGQYTVKVTTPGTVNVNVAVRTETGTRGIGSKEFRVSRIPDPKVLLGNSAGPVIRSGEIRAMLGLVARADNFPFDVRFNIRSFTLTYKKARDPNLVEKQNATGIFGADVKAILQRVGPGDRVWFDDIKVGAPDGTTRTKALSFKVIGG